MPNWPTHDGVDGEIGLIDAVEFLCAGMDDVEMTQEQVRSLVGNMNYDRIDFVRDEISVAIRNSMIEPPREVIIKDLIDEWIGPVCSPEYAARHFRNSSDLQKCVLLATKTRLNGWADWAKALAEDVEFRPQKIYDHFYLLIQAAACGLGVGMVTLARWNGAPGGGFRRADGSDGLIAVSSRISSRITCAATRAFNSGVSPGMATKVPLDCSPAIRSATRRGSAVVSSRYSASIRLVGITDSSN